MAGFNEDVNGDRYYDSLLKFVNPLTGGVESLLIEKDGHQLIFRKYGVVGRQIIYSQE